MWSLAWSLTSCRKTSFWETVRTNACRPRRIRRCHCSADYYPPKCCSHCYALSAASLCTERHRSESTLPSRLRSKSVRWNLCPRRSWWNHDTLDWHSSLHATPRPGSRNSSSPAVESRQSEWYHASLAERPYTKAIHRSCMDSNCTIKLLDCSKIIFCNRINCRLAKTTNKKNNWSEI